MNFCITPELQVSTDGVELFGSTVASVGAGYRNLRLLARSTASVDVNIPVTSEKKTNLAPRRRQCRPRQQRRGEADGRSKRTPWKKKTPDWLVLKGQPSGGAFPRLSLSPLSGAARRTDGSAEREERSSEVAKGRVGAWERPCVLERGPGGARGLASSWL